MSETSWFWDGSTGDGGSYGHTLLMDRYFRMLAGATGNLGVFDGWLNELEVTDGGANTATVATGAAMVYGGFYESDAAVDVTIPNGPRTDLIVVRRSWANKTARITRIAGPGAALTQVAGTTWDIPLAEVDVDGAGALTITDTREYTVFPTVLADGAVHSAAIATGVVTAAKLEDQTRWLSFGAGALKPEADGIHSDWIPSVPGDGFGGFLWLAGRYPWSSIWETGWYWLTFRAPADLDGDLNVYVWSTVYSTVGVKTWSWDAWVAASGAAWSEQSGTEDIDYDDRAYGYLYRDAVDSITANAGDLIHLGISVPVVRFLGIEFSYNADG